jgi:hypothetical protein
MYAHGIIAARARAESFIGRTLASTYTRGERPMDEGLELS